MPFPDVNRWNYFYPSAVTLDNTKISAENDRRLPAGTPKQVINPPQPLLGYRFRSCEQSLPSQQTSGLRYCESSPYKPIFENSVRLNEYNTKSVNSTSVRTNYCSPMLKRRLSQPNVFEKCDSTAGLSDHDGVVKKKSRTAGFRASDEGLATRAEQTSLLQKDSTNNVNSGDYAGQFREHSSGMFMAGGWGGNNTFQNYQETPCFSDASRFSGGDGGNQYSPQSIDAGLAALVNTVVKKIIRDNEDGMSSSLEDGQYGGGYSDPLYDQPAVSISSDNKPDMTKQENLLKEFTEHQYNSLGFFLKVMANDGRYEAIAYADATSKKEVLVNIDSCKKGTFTLLGKNLMNLLCLSAGNDKFRYIIRWNQDKTHIYVTLKELENLLREVSDNSFSLDIASDDGLWKNFFYYQHLSLWPLLKVMADFGDFCGISYTGEVEKNEVRVNLYAFNMGRFTSSRFDIHSANLLRNEANDAQYTPVTWSDCGQYVFVDLSLIESQLPKVLE